jgi:hypothetical protein
VFRGCWLLDLTTGRLSSPPAQSRWVQGLCQFTHSSAAQDHILAYCNGGVYVCVWWWWGGGGSVQATDEGSGGRVPLQQQVYVFLLHRSMLVLLCVAPPCQCYVSRTPPWLPCMLLTAQATSPSHCAWAASPPSACRASHLL